MLSKSLLRAAWCGFVAVSSCLPCVGASEPKEKNVSSGDAPVKLEAVKAEANPFADWGIGIWATGAPFFSVTGGAPKKMFVTAVRIKSPADLAGVMVFDLVTAVDGLAITQLPWREFVKQARSSEKGDTVKLSLSRWGSGVVREVELKIASNRNWMRADGAEDYNFWGLTVSMEDPSKVTVTGDPKRQRIAGMAEVPVVQVRRSKGAKDQREPATTSGGEPITKRSPTHVIRRLVTFHWSNQKLTLIERENRTVEVIVGGKVPEKDDLVGRLMHEGSTLTLHPDGTFNLQDAPLKPESSQASPRNPPVPMKTPEAEMLLSP